MTHVTETMMPCVLGNLNGYGYNYQNNYQNENINGNVTAGFRHTSDGQRELLSNIFTAENDIRTHLDASTNALLNGQSHITSNITSVSRDVLSAQFNSSKDISDVRREISDLNNDVNKEIAHSRLHVSQVANDVAQDIATVKESLSDKFAILLLENHKAESRTQVELLKGFANTQLDACKNTSEITRQASELSALLQAKIAECCCETQKELIKQSNAIQVLGINQASQSRELALSIENSRLKDKCDNSDRHSRGVDIEIAFNNVLKNISGK